MDMPTTGTGETTDAGDWPLRIWALCAAGGAIALASQQLLDLAGAVGQHRDARYALATFLVVSGIVAGFVIERRQIARGLGFAAGTGLVLALVAWWNIPATPDFSLDPWRIVCMLLAGAIAVPLFQTWRRDERPRLPYPEVHHHAWSAFVLWCGAWLFVAVVWTLALLLGELFGLIGLGFLRRLLGRDFIIWLLSGAALGAGIGLLRDRAAILSVLQRVVTTVLAVLAPVLALGLLLFLVALPFTGLAPLWEATRATTPILLGCIAGALVLINAAIGDTPDHDPRRMIFQASVMVLSGAMLPLALIAAVSTGIRIGQHGLTPDRLWALTFTMIACAYALAYAVVLVRRRSALAPALRDANLRLAIGVGGMALLLSSPLVAFGRLSANDQAARLESGAVSAAKFDWTAMRFEYGPAGVRVLRWLAGNGATPTIRDAAATALRRTSRWPESIKPRGVDPDRLVVLPRSAVLPPALRKQLFEYDACFAYDRCVVMLEPGARQAVIVGGGRVTLWRAAGTEWVPDRPNLSVPTGPAKAALDRGDIEIRRVERRQVFAAGQPIGDAFR